MTEHTLTITEQERLVLLATIEELYDRQGGTGDDAKEFENLHDKLTELAE